MTLFPILLVITYVVWFLYWTNGFIWKYFLDFPFSVGVLLALLTFSLFWSIFFLFKKIKKQKTNPAHQKYLFFINGLLVLLAAFNWGGFGLGALMTFIFFVIYPGTIRKNKIKSDFYFAVMLLLEIVVITVSIYL